MDASCGIKRSRRQIKISQRLADSLKQEEILAKTFELEPKKDKKTLKSNKSRKHAYQREYTLSQLKLLDGSLLVKYFSTRQLLPTGLAQYKCQLLREDKECTKTFIKRSERKCKVVLAKHLLEHVELISTKNTLHPKLYGRVRFYPHAKPVKHRDVKKKAVESKPLPITNPIIVEAQMEFLKTVHAESNKVDPDTQEQNDIKIVSNPPKPDVNEPTIQEKARLFVQENKLDDDVNDHAANIVDIENQMITGPKEVLLKAVSLVPREASQTNKETNMINTRGHRKRVVENRNNLLEREKQKVLRERCSQQPAVVLSNLWSSSSIGENVTVDDDCGSGDELPSATSSAIVSDADAELLIDVDVVSRPTSSFSIKNCSPNKQGLMHSNMLKQKHLPTILRRKNRDAIKPPVHSLECDEVMPKGLNDDTFCSEKQGESEKQLNVGEYVKALNHDHDYIESSGGRHLIKATRPLNSSLQKAVVPKKSKKNKTNLRIQYCDDDVTSTKKPTTDPNIKALAIKLINELKYRKPKETMMCTKKDMQGQSSYIIQDFYTCEICGKNFTAPNSLYGHYRGHADIKPYQCKVCGKTFTRSHSLNYHSMIHEGSARFECSYCQRKFRHPTHYKEHLNRHTGEEPYACTDCPRRFKTRNTFRRHVKTKHNKILSRIGAIPKNSRLINKEDGSGNRTFFIEN